MTTTTNQFRVIRYLAILLVVVSGLFGVAFVGAQENPDAPAPAETTVEASPEEGGGVPDETPAPDETPSEPAPPTEEEEAPENDVLGAAAAADCDMDSARNDLDVSDVVINPMTGKAVSNVTNNSMTCTYNVALSSYETGIYVPGQEQEYINNQELFDNTVRSVAPGQSAHLAVDVPSCNWQADVYWYADGADEAPVPPDFAPLQQAGTHALFDWLQDFDNGSCFAEELTVTCAGSPLNPETNETVTWTASVSGGSGQYTYSWVGNGSFPDGPGGDDSAPATTNPVTASYHAVGTKNANVTVSSPGHESVTARCSVEVVEAAQTCESTAAANLVSADGTPFNPWDAQDDITIVNGVASVVVKNISDTCEYNVGLTSYKTGVYTPGQEQEFINGQQFYDEDVRQGLASHIGPGQTATLRVDVPQCNYQIDLYAFVDGASPSPVPPDFAKLTQTHTLLDWEVNNTLGSCFVVDCPFTPPAITTTGTASGTVGAPFSHDITITGDNITPITTNNLPAGLTFTQVNATLWRISGTPTQTGTTQFGISVTNQCGTDSTSITITISGSCPVAPPIEVTSPLTAAGTVGSAFTYTVTTSGGTPPVAITITPITSNAPGLTISGATISGIPTQGGTFQYNLQAVSAGSPPECGIGRTLTITIASQPGPVCIPPTNLSPSGTLPVGTTKVTLSWNAVEGATSYNVRLDDGTSERYDVPGSATCANSPHYVCENGITGTSVADIPVKPGRTYSFWVDPNFTPGRDYCSASVKFSIPTTTTGDDDDGDDDDGGGGGGGSRRRPNVVLFSEPEVLGTSISLAQIPYTGLGTSIVQIVLFVLGLLAISAGIIYAIMRRVRIAPAASVTVTAGPARTTVSVADEAVDEPALAAYEEYAYEAPAPRPAVQIVHTPAQARFEAPVNIPVATPVAEAPRAPMNTLPSVQKSAEMPPAAMVSAARIQNEARASRTLISDDGAELIAHSAEGDEKKALERLNQIVDIAKSRYPREDGWLILDKDRVRETLFISTLSMIPLFVEWIVRGEDKKVFTFLRMLKHQEQPVADFMRKVVSDLDNAYRARMEGSDEGSNVNQHIAEVTYHLSNRELETIVGELLHGVDERYDSAYTSVRLSLVRVLDIIKERSLRAVGSTYAFAESPRIESGETAR